MCGRVIEEHGCGWAGQGMSKHGGQSFEHERKAIGLEGRQKGRAGWVAGQGRQQGRAGSWAGQDTVGSRAEQAAGQGGQQGGVSQRGS